MVQLVMLTLLQAASVDLIANADYTVTGIFDFDTASPDEKKLLRYDADLLALSGSATSQAVAVFAIDPTALLLAQILTFKTLLHSH